MNPTILLVDAASAERENWKAFLENQKYDVFTAEHPESARQLCLRLQPYLGGSVGNPPSGRCLWLARRFAGLEILANQPLGRFLSDTRQVHAGFLLRVTRPAVSTSSRHKLNCPNWRWLFLRAGINFRGHGHGNGCWPRCLGRRTRTTGAARGNAPCWACDRRPGSGIVALGSHASANDRGNGGVY